MTTKISETQLFDELWSAPMSRRGWVKFDQQTGEVELVGMKHGTTTLTGVNRVPGLGLVLTLHEVGGSHWAARGARNTHPSAMSTILLGSRMTDGRAYRYVALSDNFMVRNNAERHKVSGNFMRTLNLHDNLVSS
jgi:hypothetical protein